MNIAEKLKAVQEAAKQVGFMGTTSDVVFLAALADLANAISNLPDPDALQELYDAAFRYTRPLTLGEREEAFVQVINALTKLDEK